ncbi:MAG: capsid cement protein [Planctomycetaceae bacterium]
MAEATLLRGRHEQRKIAGAAIVSGEVHQMADGRAGIYAGLDAKASGDNLTMITEGQYTLPKTSGIALLAGGRAYWDHSANKVHFKPVNDRDFYLGTVAADAAAADTTCVVNLNVHQEPIIKLGKGSWTKSDSLGLGTLNEVGGEVVACEFDAVAEAARASLISDRSFAVGANGIMEAIIDVADNGTAAALDINVGIANAGHATDADLIAESCFIHIDGNDLNIFAESDDGTTEVGATDTTKDYVVGTVFEAWIDMRDPADMQLYIDGVNVLPATVFKLDAATGPLKALIHVEKTSNNTTAKPRILDLLVRTMED